ncbi:hypothetical protein [Holospora elegans]|uniref:hypothetical protein n=1 Tax=Holospora elegans TaxID=431043 RepID=UPI00032F5247|nr:hypothetical protein [Holospora elegans]
MGEKIRKRHSVVDTQDNLLHITVHKANTHDTGAGCRVFKEAVQKSSYIKGSVCRCWI